MNRELNLNLGSNYSEINIPILVDKLNEYKQHFFADKKIRESYTVVDQDSEINFENLNEISEYLKTNFSSVTRVIICISENKLSQPDPYLLFYIEPYRKYFQFMIKSLSQDTINGIKAIFDTEDFFSKGPDKLILEYTIDPEITEVSLSLYESGNYASAVFEAFKRVINEVKKIIPNTVPQNDDYGFMGSVFSPNRNTNIIKFNGLLNKSDIDEQRGFMNLFQAIVMLRNLKAHENVYLNDPVRAQEYLILCSFLIKKLRERR